MAPKFYQRKPTRVQRWMIGLMALAFAALMAWVVPELVGVFSPAAEDTYSEWVWDLRWPGLVTIVVLHLIAGFLLIGSAWHFIEGYVARRRRERS